MKGQSFMTKRLPREVPLALLQQVSIGVLSGMVLDGGVLGEICGFAFVAFWGGAGLILARRRNALTDVDKLLIGWGYIPLCIVSFFLTPWIWRLRGY
jgi:hypothetical protein